MAFLETPRFPIDLNYGSRGGPRYSTDIVVTSNGIESRNANWSLPLFEYDARYSVKTRTQLKEVYDFFLAQQGAGSGFRVKDLYDFTSASDGKTSPSTDDQILGTGDGIETDFQLIKVYTKGASTLSRTIKKPVTGTVIAEVNGVAKTEGVDYTVDTTTGIITFSVAPPGGHVVKAGFEYDVPCRFAEDEISITLDTYGQNGVDIGSIGNIPLIELRNA